VREPAARAEPSKPVMTRWPIRLPPVVATLGAIVGLVAATACGSGQPGVVAVSSTGGQTTTSSRPPAGPVLYGTVTAGPTCPVERPDHPCPPRPVAATIEVRRPDGTTAAATRSDAAGAFRIAVAPGSYTVIVVTGGVLPRCPRTPVNVSPSASTKVDISCDTGIR